MVETYLLLSCLYLTGHSQNTINRKIMISSVSHWMFRSLWRIAMNVLFLYNEIKITMPFNYISTTSANVILIQLCKSIVCILKFCKVATDSGLKHWSQFNHGITFLCSELTWRFHKSNMAVVKHVAVIRLNGKVRKFFLIV